MPTQLHAVHLYLDSAFPSPAKCSLLASSKSLAAWVIKGEGGGGGVYIATLSRT